jgi:hypothetical protein
MTAQLNNRQKDKGSFYSGKTAGVPGKRPGYQAFEPGHPCMDLHKKSSRGPCFNPPLLHADTCKLLPNSPALHTWSPPASEGLRYRRAEPASNARIRIPPSRMHQSGRQQNFIFLFKTSASLCRIRVRQQRRYLQIGEKGENLLKEGTRTSA